VEEWAKKLNARIEEIKKKRPGYGPMLDFYQKIREAQEHVKPSLKEKPIPLKREWKDLLKKEGFPLLQKKEFPVDGDAAVALFQTLCHIAKETNPNLSEQVHKIESSLRSQKTDLKMLLEEGWDEKRMEQAAENFEVAPRVFAFLVQNSVKPSIEATVRQLQNELDAESWLKGYCPICGSPPSLSLLRNETGIRYLLCSFCDYQWRLERLTCPHCANTDPSFLRYFSGEGEETHRVDLCDQCHQYIKTIDFRTTEVFEPSLEDLGTLHLDLLAAQQGYTRPVASFWIPSADQRFNDNLFRKEK
jgi:FdhE protein